MGARFLGALGLGVFLFGAAPTAQAPTIPPGSSIPGPPGPRVQMPARDAASPIQTGTGRISGRVVSTDGIPLRRATVRVTSAEIRVNRSATTNADGRYEITNLPVGRYSISVSRNGYVTLQFGQQRPLEPGRPLDLGDGQLMDRIDFALPRGSVIAGRITDEVGEPMAGVRVQAMRYQYLPSGQRQLVPVSTGNMFSPATNDLGEFRIFGLMPGAYLVGATYEEPGRMMMLPTDGGAPARSTTENDGFAVTYYPGTISSEDAQVVAVGIAEETAASFALVPARMTKISGVIRNSQGRPIAGGFVSLRTGTGPNVFSRGGGMVGPDGAFTINNVAPGEHSIEIYPRSSGDEWASVPVTAGGSDITGLVITTTPGVTISGQVTFEGTATSLKPDRIIVTPAEPGGLPVGRGSDDSGTIDSSSRFQLKGAAGRVLFRAVQSNPMQGGTWAIKSVTLNGVDLTDTPLDVARSGEITGLEIVVSDKQTTLSGLVRNGRGESVRDYTVAIFPDRLREGALPTRFTRMARPDQQGRYETRGLPPGDYLAVAVESLEQGGQWDPEFRKRVEPSAKRFRLTEGQSTTVDLQLMQ